MEPVAETPGTDAGRPYEPADQPAAPRDLGPWRCAADPSVETFLRCGRCEKPICPRCLIHTPVGSRCRDCAQLRRLPMFVIKPIDYLKAIGGALAGGIGGSVAMLLIRDLVPFAGILGLILMAGLGYVTGEAVARSTNRKRGNSLGIIAALGVVVGLVLVRAGLLIVGGMPPSVAFATAAALLIVPLWSALSLAIAAAVAFSRAR
jgi:hypothetical protein